MKPAPPVIRARTALTVATEPGPDRPVPRGWPQYVARRMLSAIVVAYETPVELAAAKVSLHAQSEPPSAAP
jgi:hypothetical protein